MSIDGPGHDQGPEQDSLGPAELLEPATPDQSGMLARHRRVVVPLAAAAVLAIAGGTAFALQGGQHGRPATHGVGAPSGVGPNGTGMSGPFAANGMSAPMIPGAHYVTDGTLPNGPANAADYQLTSNGVTTAEVSRLAAALHLTGTPTASSAGWTLVSGGRELYVDAGHGGAWRYGCAEIHPGLPGPEKDSAPANDGDNAPVGGTAKMTLLRLSGNGIVSGPALVPCAVTAEPVASPATARAAADPVFQAVGLDPAQAITSASTPISSMTINPTVAGLPTSGYATRLAIGPSGVLYGSGWLGGTTAGQQHRVLSALATLNRLGQQSVPGGGQGYRYHYALPPQCQVKHGGTVTDKCMLPRPTQPVRPTITVHSARFGLVLDFRNGAPDLLPGWLYVANFGNSSSGNGYVFGAEAASDVPPFAAYGDNPGGPVVNPPTPVSPPGGTPVSPRPPTGVGARYVPVRSYAVTGETTLTLYYSGMVACGSYTASVQESTTEVRVGIVYRMPNPRVMCPMIARESNPIIVHLSAPLGGRQVIDMFTNTAVPQARAGYPVQPLPIGPGPVVLPSTAAGIADN